MSELFKSRLGWALAGIYLLTVYSFLTYFYLIDRESLSGFTAMMLSVPWSILFFYFVIPMVSGGYGSSPLHLPYIVAIVIGGLINAFILYLLGLLPAKIYDYFSSGKSKT